jgi:ribosomal protein S18 acetylase RimI-like enzyme
MIDFISQLYGQIVSSVRLEPKDLVLLAIPLSLTGLGFLAKHLWQYTNDSIVSRHYRLTGRYLTFYDDPKIGEDGFNRSYAESEIKQRGTALTIKTTEPNGRKWLHRGYIVKDRFISGWYQARDPHDTGVGTFFLRIKDMDSLEGTWHGHDHQGNRNIVSGLYSFRRKRDVRIENMRPQDLASVLRISDKSFGAHYLTAEVLQSEGTQVLVAVLDKEVVGFCMFLFLKAQELKTTLGRSAASNETLRYADNAGKIGTIKSIAVDSEFRSLGVGGQLFEAAERSLFEQAASAILVPLWYWRQSASLQNIAELNGYALLAEDKEYWKHECLRGTFRCIAKKSHDCVCSCRFYFKTASRD